MLGVPAGRKRNFNRLSGGLERQQAPAPGHGIAIGDEHFYQAAGMRTSINSLIG